MFNASYKNEDIHIICEAKTFNDVDKNHTNSQLYSFVEYLETKKSSLIILGVPGETADSAKTLIRFLSQDLKPIANKATNFRWT